MPRAPGQRNVIGIMREKLSKDGQQRLYRLTGDGCRTWINVSLQILAQFSPPSDRAVEYRTDLGKWRAIIKLTEIADRRSWAKIELQSGGYVDRLIDVALQHIVKLQEDADIARNRPNLTSIRYYPELLEFLGPALSNSGRLTNEDPMQVCAHDLLSGREKNCRRWPATTPQCHFRVYPFSMGFA